MARKKAAIGELIKSDMSRRNIGENAVFLEFADEPVLEGQPAEAVPPVEKPAEETAGGAGEEQASGQNAAAKKPEKARPALKPEPKSAAKTGESGKVSAESAALSDYIAEEVESGGSMDERERRNFYDFMLAQAARYMRGFNAGKRFHQG